VLFEQVQTWIHRTQTSWRPRVGADSRVEWLVGIDLEMPVLQPAHDDPGEARRPPIGIAVASMHLPAVRQVGRLRTGQQSRERGDAPRIERLKHFSY
jgi:hypothetical protein